MRKLCLGLFCISVGLLKKQGKQISPDACSQIIAESCCGLCQRELSKYGNATTHGEKMYAKYSVARGAQEVPKLGKNIYWNSLPCRPSVILNQISEIHYIQGLPKDFLGVKLKKATILNDCL